jgi:hypothetical protein
VNEETVQLDISQAIKKEFLLPEGEGEDEGI